MIPNLTNSNVNIVLHVGWSGVCPMRLAPGDQVLKEIVRLSINELSSQFIHSSFRELDSSFVHSFVCSLLR